MEFYLHTLAAALAATNLFFFIRIFIDSAKNFKNKIVRRIYFFRYVKVCIVIFRLTKKVATNFTDLLIINNFVEEFFY